MHITGIMAAPKMVGLVLFLEIVHWVLINFLFLVRRWFLWDIVLRLSEVKFKSNFKPKKDSKENMCNFFCDMMF